MLYYFRIQSEGKDKILADLCNRFLNRKLFLYHDLRSNEEKLKLMDFYCQKGFNPRYYVVSDDQSQIPYLYYNNGSEIGEIEILVSRELKVLPEVSEIVGAITNSTKNKIDHKIFYPEL